MAALEVVEIRTLDGANIFMPCPAIKVQLHATAAEPAALAVAGARLARWLPFAHHWQPDSPGDPVSRELLAPALASLHAALELPQPTIQLGTAGDVGDPVVAFAWEWRQTADGIARGAVALVQAALAHGELDAAGDVDGLIAELRRTLARDRERGDRPLFVRDADRRIPIVGLTGTNGKTTTTRCLAHIVATTGKLVGMANSSGVWIGDEQVLEGDYTGPAGARRVLEDERVEVAVLETARGGILLRGIAYESNDVGVVTNISADHLGLQGIDTVEGLAMVKSLVVRLTRPEGRAILNADNLFTRAMAEDVRAPVTFFTRQPLTEELRAHLATGGQVILVEDGAMALAVGAARTPLVALADVPMTFGGRAPHMVENALAAGAAALALGLDVAVVARGLTTFYNSPEQNFGRLNVFQLDEPRCTVIVDFAHNEAGISQLLAFGEHFRELGGRLVAIIGTAGDRPETILRGIGRIAGERADRVWIKETDHYLRGMTKEAMNAAFITGVTVGRGHPDGYTIAPGELPALQSALAEARDGDVIAIMCLEEQAAVLALLGERGKALTG